MATIDADAHVVESEHTWDYMDPSERKYRPALVSPNGAREERPVRSILDTGSARSYWLIDGKIRGLARTVLTARQWQELAEASGRAMEVTPASQSLENVEVRVQHMDQLGIDVQVVYPTIFIEQVTDKPEIEVALCKSYNRWMADIWQQGSGRVRWMCVLPLLSMRDALDMLPWCKDNGAVGVFMRPIEGERLLHDPYFDRLYEAVSGLNLCLGVHVANANPRERDLLGQRVAWGGGFWPFLTPVVGACHAAISSGLMQRHPGLRLGFIEASASWLPWVINDIRRRAEGRKLPAHFLEELRIFVTCYTSDDIGYITRQAGAGVLMIGTDYGHQDMSVELDALRTLGERGDLEPVVAQKILDENPRALYGL
jgi:predicted TIM-barrel fold metal-dependent hydrolase